MPMNSIFDDEVSLTPQEQKRVNELEYIIPILVTLHGEGEPTLHPSDGHFVRDQEFDKMIVEL
jgi:hypothetical protein